MNPSARTLPLPLLEKIAAPRLLARDLEEAVDVFRRLYRSRSRQLRQRYRHDEFSPSCLVVVLQKRLLRGGVEGSLGPQADAETGRRDCSAERATSSARLIEI